MKKNKNQKKIVYPSFEKWAKQQERKSKAFRDAAREEYWRLKVALAIAETRKRKKLTQGQLAKRSGIPRLTIIRAESGRQNLTIEKMGRIFDVLGIDFKPEAIRK